MPLLVSLSVYVPLPFYRLLALLSCMSLMFHCHSISHRHTLISHWHMPLLIMIHTGEWIINPGILFFYSTFYLLTSSMHVCFSSWHKLIWHISHLQKPPCDPVPAALIPSAAFIVFFARCLTTGLVLQRTVWLVKAGKSLV